MRNRAKLASLILLIYFLISSASFLWTFAKSNHALFYVFNGPEIYGVITLIVCAAAGWGLSLQRLWAWQLSIVFVVIKLLMHVSVLISLVYIYFKTGGSYSGVIADTYSRMIFASGLEFLLLIAFLIFLLNAKTRKLFSDPSSDTEAGPYVSITGLGLANISLALAFTISLLFSIGGKLLVWLFGEPLLRSIPPYQGHLFNVFANYWIPAILIYFAFRLTKARNWLRPSTTIQVLVGLGNLLFILFVSARVLASTVQGGGASFVLMQFAPIVVLPAKALIIAGLTWLFVRSFQKKTEDSDFTGMMAFEKLMIAAFCAVPISYVAYFYVAEDGAFRLAREAKIVFEKKCVLAGEVLPQEPVGTIQSLYIDSDGGARFGVKDGIILNSGGGILGEPLVNSGFLLFFETKNQFKRQPGKYKKYSFADGRKWEYSDSFTSRYAVLVTNLSTGIDPRLKVGGAEVSIVDLEENKKIASTTYFVSRREGKFCGDIPSGYFDTGEFIRRALGLKIQYPSVSRKTTLNVPDSTSTTQ
jgi:hypothetical protein